LIAGKTIKSTCTCVQHSPTQSLQCLDVMPGLGYLGMAYGPVLTRRKRAPTKIWTMDHGAWFSHLSQHPTRKTGSFCPGDHTQT